MTVRRYVITISDDQQVVDGHAASDHPWDVIDGMAASDNLPWVCDPEWEAGVQVTSIERADPEPEDGYEAERDLSERETQMDRWKQRHPDAAADLPDAMPMDGAALWRAIVLRHGADRCPGVLGQAAWTAGEVGELLQAIQKALFAGCDPARLSGIDAVRKELGDAGLALYGVASKLGVDLLGEMAVVVHRETRTFSPAESMQVIRAGRDQ